MNNLADPTAILATKPIIESSEVARVLSELELPDDPTVSDSFADLSATSSRFQGSRS